MINKINTNHTPSYCTTTYYKPEGFKQKIDSVAMAAREVLAAAWIHIGDIAQTAKQLLSNVKYICGDTGRDAILKNARNAGEKRAISHLFKRGYQLNTSTFQAITDKLLNTHGKKCVIRTTDTKTFASNSEKFLKGTEQFIENSLNSKEARNLIFIPFVQPGHITLITIDKTNAKIEYYDPQGYGIDNCYRLKKKFPKADLRQELIDLAKTSFPIKCRNLTDTRIFENYILDCKTKHQQDVHSCGVYVSDYMQRRLGGDTFETIQKSGKNARTIEKIRLHFAEVISQQKK